MSYQPSTSSATTVADLRNWIGGELLRVANTFITDSQTTLLPVLNAAPAKPQTGQIVFADGTNWNPNSGRGLYYYDSGSWVHIA